MQKAHRDVKSRAAPALEREEAVEAVREERRDLGKIVGADACSKETLVSVAERRIGQKASLVVAHGLCERLGPLLL